ncbi:MAG TPA: ArsR family transcriptional regulator, partial [Rhodospirillaceae bacterium]|nr:ArsR family transcriptional regulator [Rhodospirillaceae bacterium]
VSHVKSALSIRASKAKPGVPVDVDAPDDTD